MLDIQGLHAQIGDKQIINGLNLSVKPGEVHAIMGPNGSGKSTFVNTLAGRGDILVTNGHILYKGQSISSLSIEERAKAGIFLAFQYPVELPGVTNIQFLKEAVNAKKKANNQPPLDAIEFLNLVREKIELLQMDESLLYRSMNEGFSGGEKKRNEMLQMLLLEPNLILLDETDSGLDIDALKMVAKSVNSLKSPERAIVLVTHYQRLLDYIEPDFVHVLSQGQLVRSGGKELASELESKGYGWLEPAGAL